MTIRIPDPKANTTTEAYLAYKAGVLEESELKPVLYEPYLHFDGWLAYWTGLVDYFPVKRSEDGRNLMPILQGKISYRGLDITVDKNGTITLNGHTTGAVTIKLTNGLEESGNVTTAWVNQHITDDVNGKCMSIRYVSGSAPASSTALRLYGSSGSVAIAQWYFRSDDQNTVFATTSKASCLVIYANQGLNFNNYKFRVQLEDNPTPTDYIPYGSVPEMLCDEEACVAYLAGVTDTYPKEIKDPYDVRLVGYLKHLIGSKWEMPELQLNNSELYLSMLKTSTISSGDPSSNIDMEDTAEAPFESLEAYGDTTQQTYTGRNLLDVPSRYSFKVASKNISLPAGTYFVSCGDVVKGGENYPVFVCGGKSVILIGDTVPFTIDSDATQITFYSNGYNYQASADVTSTVNNLMVSKVVGAYEPYVGSTAETTVTAPNPDYPQTVNTVTGRQSVWVCGKNLFNQYATKSGEYLDAGGGWTTGSLDSYINQEYLFNGGETLYISFASKTGSAFVRLGQWKEDGTFLGRSLINTVGAVTLNALTKKVVFSTSAETNAYFSDLQIEIGNQVSSYEPYQGQIYEINLGKNILKGTPWVTAETTAGYPKSGPGLATITSSDDNNIVFSTSATYRGVESNFIRLPANTTITASFSGSSMTNRFWITQYDLSKTRVSTLNTPSNVATTTVTTTRDGYVTLAFGNTTAGDFSINNIQLEIGATASEFANYFTPIELCKLGDFQDKIYKDGDNWYLHKETNKVVLNGTETWNMASTVLYTATIEDYAISKNTPVCPYFIGKPNVNVAGDVGSNKICFNNNQSIPRFYVSYASKFASTSAFTTWLETHNMPVYYGLSDFSDTEITNNDLISQLEAILAGGSYQGRTIITVTANGDNLPALLKVVAERYE